MPIESFLEYIRYEKNLSTHTVLSYRDDLFQFKKFLETFAIRHIVQKLIHGVLPKINRYFLMYLRQRNIFHRAFLNIRLHHKIAVKSPQRRNLTANTTSRHSPFRQKSHPFANTIGGHLLHLNTITLGLSSAGLHE